MNSQKFRLCVRSCQTPWKSHREMQGWQHDRKILKNLEIWVNRCWTWLSYGFWVLVNIQTPWAISTWSSMPDLPRDADSSFVMLSPLLISRGYGRNGCDEIDLKSCGDDFFRGKLWDCCLTSLPLTFSSHVRVISKESLQDLATRYPEKSKPKDGRLTRDTQAAVKWASLRAVYTSWSVRLMWTVLWQKLGWTTLVTPRGRDEVGVGVLIHLQGRAASLWRNCLHQENCCGDPQRTRGGHQIPREVPITKERLGSWHPGSHKWWVRLCPQHPRSFSPPRCSPSSSLPAFDTELWMRAENSQVVLGNGGEAADHASFSLQATSQSWAHQIGWIRVCKL